MMQIFTALGRRGNSLSAKRLKYATLTCAGACLLFTGATVAGLRPVVSDFNRVRSDANALTITDRTGQPLSISYQTDWNAADNIPLYEIPPLLVQAFVFSEDRKFNVHHGVDWRARISALWQNIRHGQTVRGASTITEQVVRMIHPRPRNLWSKWLEGVEATWLESHTDKNTILEFYLNQIPYAAHRRGVVQAARYYFNRDLDTLDIREMLALAVLARAPSAYDLYRAPQKIDAPLERLAAAMKEAQVLPQSTYADFQSQTLETHAPSLPVEARHFARFARMQNPAGVIRTTLDGGLQARVQDIIDARVKKLGSKNVHNAGALVMDYTTGDILVWVNAGAMDDQTPGGNIDAVLTPRQPGSTLKPFLYATALDHTGWTAATLLNDAPVAEAVGAGLHRFHNYSYTHYGPITVREALGNSLNIPAILTIHAVGVNPFLNILHRLGYDSLDRSASVYDEGLALGNGEVTLYEMVRAYAALANRGVTIPLQSSLDTRHNDMRDAVFTPETSSIIGNILSDPRARMLEFGRDSILNFPVRTAVKTGTSTDYKDAWTIGYNDRYVVGIWMGNLDRTPMKDVTGSTGPALALRAIFQTLNENRETKPLYLSPALIAQDVCIRPRDNNGDCPRRTELFAKAPANDTPEKTNTAAIELVRPTNGLLVAYDPRIPADHQKFRFELAGLKDGENAEWILNGHTLGRSDGPRYLWLVEKGKQALEVKIYSVDGGLVRSLNPVHFLVR